MQGARVKKVGQETTASWRNDQRRLRNKLSQKAVRERKAARVKQLEQQLAAVTKEGDGGRVEELLNINSNLRHALLDTRKKLASLAATVSQLGNYLKVVLDGDGASEHDVDGAVDQTNFMEDQTYLRENNTPAPRQSPPTISTGSLSGLEPDDFDCAEMDLIIPSTYIDSETAYKTTVTDQADSILVSTESMFNCSKPIEEPANVFPGLLLEPKLRVYTHSVFSEHLECVQKLIRLRGALRNEQSMPPLVEAMLHAFIKRGWPSMEYWFSATRSIPLGCRVLWWQTSSSSEAATRVPIGNTPTLIQLSRPSYPCILDWVPHPGLRDLLILNYQSYDVDQVICDMTNAFVVEVEEAEPFADVSHLGFILSSRSSTGCSFSLMELVERAFVSGPVHSGNSQELTAMRLLQSTSSSDYVSIEHPIHRFKLDPSFFDKYPALYDANAESRYRPKHFPLTQKSQLPLPYNTETVKEYMNVATEAGRFVDWE